MKHLLLLLFLLPLLSLHAQNSPLLVHQTPSIQVYNLQPEGFVIISTDNASSEILGFSDHGSFSPDSLPLGLKDLLNSYNEEIQLFGSHSPRTSFSFANINAVPDNVIVAPLLKTHWAQTQYYNNACPEDSKGSGGHAMVGCGAVVMGQVMCYWQYPEHGKGSHSYTANFASYGYGNYGTLFADFENTYYDYDNMPAKLYTTSTSDQVTAVSTLLYHCGVACNMVYGPTASTASSNYIVNALNQYFRFNVYGNIEYIEKSAYTASQWNTVLQDELDEGAPFFYGASGSYGGHVFICDGYGEKGSDLYYHLNWGWAGTYDGWYKISAFNPGPYDFNNNHAAIIGIRGENLPTYVDDVTDTPQVLPEVEKFYIDGQLYIKVNNRIYNLAGQPVSIK